jgi:hypothetical protein
MLVRTAVFLGAIAVAQAQPITLNSLLQEMADRDALARFPSPAYTQRQGSTYNRVSTQRDQTDQTFSGWFADSDGVGFIRTENTNASGATEYVIMEHQGPGAITKLWTPFFYHDFNNRTGPNIRIYLNGSRTPVIDENFIELVTRLEWSTTDYGAKPNPRNTFTLPPPMANFTARAGDCYLPIPFSGSCKVTLSGTPFYDIVSYRTYPVGTQVENFSMASLTSISNQAQMALTLEQLAHPTNFSGGQLLQATQTIAANEALTLTLPAGSAAIRHLEVQVDPAQIETNPAALRSTVLIMNFDGEQTVWCPLGDFFCSADELHPYQTWTRTVTANDDRMVCRWVMPYQTNASVTLTNLGTTPVSVSLGVRSGDWAWDSGSMHFHANWRPDDVRPGTPPVDWNFIDITGKGVFVGDAWTVLDIHPGTWWGEGDEKIYVDAEYGTAKFPGIFGTGTEDYYGWAGGVVPTRTDEFSNPYLANVRVGGLDGHTLGFNINTRIRALDAIPFNQRLVFDMESSFGTDIRNPWNLLGYSAVVFWYAIPGATHNRPAQPAAAAQPIQTIAQLQIMSDAIRYPVVKPNGIPRPRWNMGEQDAGAKAGAPGGRLTKDAKGTNDLIAFGAPVYSASVPGTGSTLSMSFNGSSFYVGEGAGFASLFDGLDFNNCSISCDVYPTALGSSGFSFPFSVGGSGTGFAIVEIGGKWFLINHNLGYSPAGPSVILNAWTHLQLIRRDFGSGVETRLFVNGAYTGAAITSSPNTPANSFFVGANRLSSGPEGDFRGLIDNVELDNAAPVFLEPIRVTPSTNITAGGGFKLSAVVAGLAPLNFTWRLNGTVLTNSSAAPAVIFDEAFPAQSGNYDVIATNLHGRATGEVGRISIIPVAGAAPGPLVGHYSPESNHFEVDCSATIGATYSLWRTMYLNPIVWSNIAIGTPDDDGNLVLKDRLPPEGSAFYRATSP